MPTTRFRVIYAGPMVTFQDIGRAGYMRFGVPASGPMDRISYATANLAVGNSKTATTIEVSLGGIALECVSGATTVAIAGGGFQVECEHRKSESGTVVTVTPGQTLSIRPGRWGSWCYLAFCGRVSVEEWLGKTATYSQSGFGGGILQTGREFEIEDSAVAEEREGEITCYSSRVRGKFMRIVLGPQDQYFTPEAKEQLLNSAYILSNAYDRMGVRLDGPALNIDGSLSIPSEPILKGSIQISGDGVPTVLLADHQTTGGYPKIATLISADFDDFVQRRSGDRIRFKEIAAEEAVNLARTRAIERDSYFADVAKSKGTLTQRLMEQNLISGVLSGDEDEQSKVRCNPYKK